MRIVYDASAKSDGPSLNDCLYSGPSLEENIVDILLRFRCHPTAIVGDIDKAFLIINVAAVDRDVLRFLWVDDVNKDDPQIVIYRFTRVVFGVTASPFLLNGMIKHLIERYSKEDPEFVQKFLSGIYVDDLSSGAADDDAAYGLYIKLKQQLSEGGFNLRKFLWKDYSRMKVVTPLQTINQLRISIMKFVTRINHIPSRLSAMPKTYH